MAATAMKVVLVGIYPYSPVGLAPATLKAYCDAQPSLRGASIVTAGFLADAPAAAVAAALLAERPDVVGFSTYLWNHALVAEVARLCKASAPATAVVLGGPDVCGDPGGLLERYPFVDFAVAGEGEVTLTALLERLLGRDGLGLSDILGLTWRNDGAAAVNPPRPLIEDLGTLPSPFTTGALDVDRIGSYLFALETYRGCPLSCRFCLWGKHRRVRYFPIERVEADLRAILSSHAIRRAYLSDPICNLNRVRFRRILTLLVDENPNRIVFDFEMLADAMDEETAGLMGRLHDGYVAFGLQSTNPPALERMGRRWSREAFERGVRRLRRGAGRLKLYIDLIYGLPGDDYRGYLESLRYVMSLLPDKVQPHPLQVLPGSEFWADAARFGIEFSRQAPYLATESATFSAAEVRRAAAWTVPLHVYFNPAVHAAVALVQTYGRGAGAAGAGEAARGPFNIFARLTRCLRRAFDLLLIAREVDVSPDVASRLARVLDAFVRGELGVAADIVEAAREAVRFLALQTALTSKTAAAAVPWQPPAAGFDVAPAHILVAAPDNLVARFSRDVTALVGANLMSDPHQCEALPRQPVAVVINRRLNEPLRLSPALARLVELCDGRRTAREVAAAFARENGFEALDAVAPRLLEALADLVRHGVLDVAAPRP